MVEHDGATAETVNVYSPDFPMAEIVNSSHGLLTAISANPEQPFTSVHARRIPAVLKQVSYSKLNSTSTKESVVPVAGEKVTHPSTAVQLYVYGAVPPFIRYCRCTLIMAAIY